MNQNVFYLYSHLLLLTKYVCTIIKICSPLQQATPFVSQVLIHTQPRPFLAVGLYILSCIVSGVASILLPMETKGTVLEDVFTSENDKSTTEMDSLLRSESEIDVEKTGDLDDADE